jgi:diguanylate cyclase (GGDEF)-like protein
MKRKVHANYRKLIARFTVIFLIASVLLIGILYAILFAFSGGRADKTGGIFAEYLAYFILAVFLSLFAAVLLLVGDIVKARFVYFQEYDSMTGAYNRIAGLKKFGPVFAAGDKHGLSVCFIDIDGLKDINREFGHETGDGCVLAVANVIIGAIRENDFFVRLSGDEFLLVFPDTGEAEAAKIFERISAKIDGINHKEKRPYRIGISHGITALKPSFTSADDMIRAAEEKMLKEKNAPERTAQTILPRG